MRIPIAEKEITSRRILEAQLSQAQKLESIGQLAAGVAHELNTPIQYVGDNTRFLQESFAEIFGILESCQRFLKESETGPISADLMAHMRNALNSVDIEYLSEEIPLAIRQSLEGIEQVTNIVQAMRQFSHPGVAEKTYVDINKTLESTVTVARNEWKYVAEVEMNLDPDLPLVLCMPGEINQVFLNILINAAHAIADTVADDSNSKGNITIATRRDGDRVEIRISDTGTGISEEVQSRIFDPFFTTKDVDKGTGQGLAISHNVVAEKHGGSIFSE